MPWWPSVKKCGGDSAENPELYLRFFSLMLRVKSTDLLVSLEPGELELGEPTSNP